jgi:peptide/nickel transport system permease protein
MTPRFVAIKLARGLFTMWLVVSFTFVALHASGDPIQALVGDQASQEVIDYYTHMYGLDRPLWEQYLSYFAGIFHGDFGLSLSNRTPALDLILGALPNTLRFAASAFSFGLLLGIPSGIVAALHRNKAFDRFAMGFAVFGFSLPNFFLGIMLILVFSLHLRLLPSAGSDTPLHLILPTITLGTYFAGMFARFTRSAMLEVLDKPYISAARAKGVSYRRRVLWHALPNAAIPIITIVGLRMGELVSGSLVIETVFGWPGIGRLLVTAVGSRDLAVVQAAMILVSCTMVATNVAVDLLYTLLDPRIRTSAGKEGEQG